MAFLCPTRLFCARLMRAVRSSPHWSDACPTGSSPFSLILTLTAGGRDYALAGLVMGLFGLTIVLVSPFRAWMVDRHRPRRALLAGSCGRGDVE